MLGFPVADMPGGEIPHYEPLDFTAGEHTHQTSTSPKALILRKNRLIAQNSRHLSPSVVSPLTADKPNVEGAAMSSS